MYLIMEVVCSHMPKTLKISLISIVSLVLVLYGGVFLGHKIFVTPEAPDEPGSAATIEPAKNERFTFGPQAHSSHPTTLKGFMPILADQLARYNKVAPDLWPDNTLINQTLVVEDLTNQTYWLIKPDGTFAEVTEKDVSHYGYERLAYPNGFSFFKGGMYLALDEAELKDPATWEKYLHLGTYSAIIWLIHEGFHEMQGAWAETDLANSDREDHLDDIPARVQRALLQKQLFHAVSRPGDTQAILAALATYEDWKTRFPLDFEDSLNADRYEGTAYYFEFVASLLVGYPDQVKNLQDVDAGLALLATREDVYIGHGLVMEGYSVGGFAAILLERLEKDWKGRLMADPGATAMEMLRQHFADQKLPAPTQLSPAETDAIVKDITAARERIAAIGGGETSEVKDNSAEVEESTATKVFRYLYDRLYWWLPKK